LCRVAWNRTPAIENSSCHSGGPIDHALASPAGGQSIMLLPCASVMLYIIRALAGYCFLLLHFFAPRESWCIVMQVFSDVGHSSIVSIACMCECVCVCVFVCACMRRVWVRAYVRACMRACVCVSACVRRILSCTERAGHTYIASGVWFKLPNVARSLAPGSDAGGSACLYPAASQA
jgi:hypothetical protein